MESKSRDNEKYLVEVKRFVGDPYFYNKKVTKKFESLWNFTHPNHKYKHFGTVASYQDVTDH